jgi:hypothetical protein
MFLSLHLDNDTHMSMVIPQTCDEADIHSNYAFLEIEWHMRIVSITIVNF